MEIGFACHWVYGEKKYGSPGTVNNQTHKASIGHFRQFVECVAYNNITNLCDSEGNSMNYTHKEVNRRIEFVNRIDQSVHPQKIINK